MIRIGTRKSPLAIAQATMVQQALLAAHPAFTLQDVPLVPMTTSGDTGAASEASQWGLKGLFTKELEDALLSHSIDIAVHSMKDMPSILPEGLILAAMLAREDVRDALVSPHISSIDALPKSACVGTVSTRRRAQILHLRPDITVVPLRGNVGTRIKKLEEGHMHATFLAMAGLNRLGLARHAREIISSDVMLPAVAQGAVGIECRSEDSDTQQYLSAISHADTVCCVTAERAMMLALDASCKSPIAGLAVREGTYISLRGQVLAIDGSNAVSNTIMGPMGDAERLGRELGNYLRREARRFGYDT